ncbi:MAG TPA: hypothetical protein VJU78_10400 [Chitinophagaceae bacterium]|nr:hypothetical protein [Chitinophagaceae bacterium]
MKTQLSAFAISAMIITTGFSPAVSEYSVDTKLKVNAEQVQSPVFTSFSTHRQGKGIALSWAVESFAGVLNFSIQRTYEDVTDPYAVWEDISSLPADGSKFYRYTDEAVSPGFVSYRVSALLSDGTTAESVVSTIHIVSR